MKSTIFILILLVTLTVRGIGINDYYNVENIPTPKGLDPQIGGLTFLPNGRLAACFHRGEVYIYNLKTKEWKLFADGLHEPSGIIAEDNHTLVVMQRPELTLLRDTDGDGEAAADDCVDINTAGVSDLDRIVNIGPSRADQMLGLRPFSSVEDMIRISGIGEASLAEIVEQGLACVR